MVLNEEGFNTSRYLIRKLMKKLKLKVVQRLVHKVIIKHKYGDKVADNFINQNFNPLTPNELAAGDITYLKIAQDWMYLAIVMDLYSYRIVSWHIKKRMTTDLIIKATYYLGGKFDTAQTRFVFHRYRVSQYTRRRLSNMRRVYDIPASMCDLGVCWDNVVGEFLFGSLKHDWIL
jgi:putative transposase